MKIKRRVELEFRISLPSWDDNTKDTISRQLADQGFDNIEGKGDVVTASRGKWWRALLISDPRQLYQTICVKQTSVSFNLSTWWCFLGKADEDILEIEASDIEGSVSNRQPDPNTMAEAQRKRRWSDARSMLITIVITAVIVFLICCAALRCLSPLTNLD